MTYSTPITLGTTYYNCPEHLNDFVEDNIDYVDHLIIVDDGSEPSKRASLYLDKHSKLSLYEVTKDVGFNSHGCRNLIMKECQTDWCMLLDIDRKFIYNDYDWEQIHEALPHLDENMLWKMQIFVNYTKEIERKGALTLKKSVWVQENSVNDFLISKKLFWSVGGYDEEYVGIRHGDRQFLAQIETVASGVGCLLHPCLRFTRKASLIEGGIKPLKLSWMPELKETIKNRIKNPSPNKPVLQFPWRKVF